jgi:large subunit ribosomal protein L14e
MMEVGRVCMKIAGRDAGKHCVITEVLDKNFVMIDGQTRRRKCNILHLEPLKETVSIKSKASHDEIVSALKQLDIEVTEKKGKKEKAEKQQKQRKTKVKETVAEKPQKKPVKKKESVKEKKK